MENQASLSALGNYQDLRGPEETPDTQSWPNSGKESVLWPHVECWGGSQILHPVASWTQEGCEPLFTRLEQSQAWRRQVVLGPVHHHTSHSVAQPHSHPYIHIVLDTVVQPKVNIATHSHTTSPQAHKPLLATYTYMHSHVLLHLQYCHTFTTMSTLGHVYTCHLFTTSVSVLSSLSAILQSHAHNHTLTQ